MTDGPGKQIPIVRTNPDEVPLTFVNDMLVTHTGDVFYITFSQLELPTVATPSELEKIDKAEAVATYKLVVTPTFLKKIIKTLNINYEKYLEIIKGEKDE